MTLIGLYATEAPCLCAPTLTTRVCCRAEVMDVRFPSVTVLLSSPQWTFFERLLRKSRFGNFTPNEPYYHQIYSRAKTRRQDLLLFTSQSEVMVRFCSLLPFYLFLKVFLLPHQRKPSYVAAKHVIPFRQRPEQLIAQKTPRRPGGAKTDADTSVYFIY